MKDIFGNEYSTNQESRIRHHVRAAKSHYRAHIASICYPEISKGIVKIGPYDMPIVQRNINVPSVIDTTPFDRISAKTSTRDSIVTFYINDNRFAHRLAHPWDYTDLLTQYQGVIAPDLSQYIDMDYSQRMSNNYWNKVYTVYWQNRGVNMYPNVTWSLPDSYEYSVAGLPTESVIAINSVGVLNNNFSTSVWLDGYYYMLEALNPICILRYGPKVSGENESISIYLNNNQLNLLRNGSKRK